MSVWGVRSRSAAGLFGAHVLRSTEGHPGVGDRAVGREVRRQRPRDAEVSEQRISLGRQEDVLRLDVAVNHAVLVRIVEGARDLPRDPERILERQLLDSAQPIAQALAFHVGHGEPEQPGGRPAGVMDGEDVRVLELGDELDFSAEALRSKRRGEVGVEHLHGDSPMVLGVEREKYRGHATAPELTLERVRVAECRL